MQGRRANLSLPILPTFLFALTQHLLHIHVNQCIFTTREKHKLLPQSDYKWTSEVHLNTLVRGWGSSLFYPCELSIIPFYMQRRANDDVLPLRSTRWR